jgi:hypothetical protein
MKQKAATKQVNNYQSEKTTYRMGPVGFLLCIIPGLEISDQGFLTLLPGSTLPVKLMGPLVGHSTWLSASNITKTNQLSTGSPYTLARPNGKRFYSLPLASLGLAFFSCLFLCLNRYKVDQSACCLKRLPWAEWKENKYLFQEL